MCPTDLKVTAKRLKNSFNLSSKDNPKSKVTTNMTHCARPKASLSIKKGRACSFKAKKIGAKSFKTLSSTWSGKKETFTMNFPKWRNSRRLVKFVRKKRISMMDAWMNTFRITANKSIRPSLGLQKGQSGTPGPKLALAEIPTQNLDFR